MNKPAFEAPPHSARKRVRLAPDVRRRQILDASLIEFSAVGFQGATMECIARRVGITKAGIYAHFESKDAIFEALLIENIFNQTQQPRWQWREGCTLEEVVDDFLERAYQSVQDPSSQATFRLLISESGRAPELIRRWHHEIFQPYTQQRQNEVDACVANGLVADCAAARCYSLLSSPALLAMIGQLILGGEEAERDVAHIRAAHREMLLILLTPRETA